MSYYFQQDETLLVGAERIAALLLDNAVEALAVTPEHYDSGIHDCRRLIKMLRALLQLVRPAMRRSVFSSWNQTLRDTARRLAGIRDEAALAEVVERFLQNPTLALPDASLLPRLQGLLAEGRGASQEHTASPMEDARTLLSGLRGGLDVSVLGECGIKGGRAILRQGIYRSYRAGRQGWKAIHRGEGIDAVHEWRKQAKHLRYQIMFLKPVWPGICTAWENELHQLTDATGLLHDLWMLDQRLRTLPPGTLSLEEITMLTALITDKTEESRKKALATGRRCYYDRPNLFADRWMGWWDMWRNEASVRAGGTLNLGESTDE